MISIGIDPGKQGAIAVLYSASAKPMLLLPMPLIRARVVKGKKYGRDEYDLAEIAMVRFDGEMK